MELQLPIIEELKKETNAIALLSEHHVSGLFFEHFLIEEFQKKIRHQYQKQWIHNHILLEEISLISHGLLELQINATMLKGIHLLFDLYPDIGSRFMSDIDLLIDSNDMSKWSNLLTSLNYRPILQKTFYANNFKAEWTKKVGEIEVNIELHTRLFFHLKSEDWRIEKSSFNNIYQLKKEDLFLHLCGHLALQHTFIKLYWLFDIYFLLKKYQQTLDWNYILNKSHKAHLFKSVQMTLWVLSKYFNLKIDENVSSYFKINYDNYWKKILTLNFLLRPYDNKLHYYLLKHATKDRLLEAFRYDLSWIFHSFFQKR